MHLDKNKLIFIVDDNEIYSLMLDYILSKESVYNFERYRTGEDCLQNLHKKPDMIILDYVLPGMNGYAILLEIKRQNPKIHVIMITAQKDKKLAEELIHAGADDCIFKQPNSELRVIEKIDALFNKDALQIESYFWARRPAVGHFLYVMLVLLLVALGIFYYS